jgi:hypothetical protein
VKVRIKARPREQEIDGVRLDRLVAGSVTNVSATLGTWLITEGYAEPEMRQERREEEQDFSGFSGDRRHRADDRPRRRSTDR